MKLIDRIFMQHERIYLEVLMRLLPDNSLDLFQGSTRLVDMPF